jgi:hypothetical protein
MANQNVIDAITKILEMDAKGQIPKDAPVSFSFQGHPDEEYQGEDEIDPNEASEDEGSLPGMIGGRIPVEQESPINEGEAPMLAHVLKVAAVKAPPEPRRYSNGAAVTKENQKRPGLPPAPKRK